MYNMIIEGFLSTQEFTIILDNLHSYLIAANHVTSDKSVMAFVFFIDMWHTGLSLNMQ